MTPFATYALGALLALSCLTVSAADSTLTGAERHIKMGLQCSVCHGTGKEPAEATITQCSVCHPTEALAKRTEKKGQQNPHTSPHYGTNLECTNCHVMHEKGAGEDYCAQCHKFNFKVP